MHQGTKSARLIAVCKRSFSLAYYMYESSYTCLTLINVQTYTTSIWIACIKTSMIVSEGLGYTLFLKFQLISLRCQPSLKKRNKIMKKGSLQKAAGKFSLPNCKTMIGLLFRI